MFTSYTVYNLCIYVWPVWLHMYIMCMYMWSKVCVYIYLLVLMAMCFSLRLGMIIWNQQPGSEKNQDQCTVKLVNLPPIPSLPIASVHICYFFCKNNATYLRGIPCLQGNYCISMYFEEVESFLKQWSYKKDKSKAELHYRMFIFPHLCIYIYTYILSDLISFLARIYSVSY